MNRIALSIAFVLSGLLASSPALAIDDAACCAQSTSKVDGIINPARGSDEKFFGRAGGPPNILFILDNSGSMEGQSTGDYGAWPLIWDNTSGCGWGTINALGYSKNVTYPAMRNSVTSKDPFVKDWFEKGKFYNAPKMGYGNNFKKAPTDTGAGNLGTAYANDTDACAGAPNVATCKSCLANAGYYIFGQSTGAMTNERMESYYSSGEWHQNWQVRDDAKDALANTPAPVFQEGTGCDDASGCATCTTWTDHPATPYYDGYNRTRVEFPHVVECARLKSGTWIANSSERRVTGNFLNFYAPRDSGAVSVLSNIVNDLKEVRFALYTLNQNTASDVCFWGSDGGCVVNKIGPSCNKSYPWDQSSCDSNRNSILTPLTSKIKFASGTPITGALYAAGYYFSTHTGTGLNPAEGYSTDVSWAKNANGLFNDADAVCWSCGFNAIVLLSDGEPNTEKSIPSAMNAMTATNKCAKVAEYLWTHDIRAGMDGVQKVATYTIGFSGNAAYSGTLQEVAAKGGGQFYPATSTQGLRDAMLLIIEDIARRNTSFSTSNISAVQSGSTTGVGLVPRMMPISGKPWTGKLFMMGVYNEWAADNDYNTDGDKEDVFFVDSANDIVVEDSDGKFIKKSGGAPAVPHWEANDRLQANGHNSRKIYTIVDASGAGGSKDGYFTEHDNAAGMIEFKGSNWNKLVDYMGIRGTGMCPFGFLAGEEGIFLGKLHVSVDTAAAAIKTATSYDFKAIASPTPANWDEFCTRMVIQYMRGQDLDDADSDGSRTDTRPAVLGDIFHSSPLFVMPPANKNDCCNGGSNQCVGTLFTVMDCEGFTPENTPTPLAKTHATHCGTTKDFDAYEMYAWNNRHRNKIALVGANDGMLHAFAAGTENGDDTAGSWNCDGTKNLQDPRPGEYVPSFDSGNGNELWAFIPPDQLSRLADIVLAHQFYVDGDIMVRDIWADGSGTINSTPDGIKQWDEFHTIAIVAEGRGGTHYFALEIKFDGSLKAAAVPDFRWIYPQPCTAESMLFGKTLYALSPKPPPVGPVLIDTSTITGLPGTKRQGEDVTDPTTTERYVAFLSGGWSPSLEKGRGVYMVDAWNGFVQGRNDNLWWKLARDKDGADTGEQRGPVANMTHSIVAPVAMVDYGPNEPDSEKDGFFDTALVGDTRGQVWTARFYKPGTWDSGDKTITNWSGARAFEQDIEGVAANADEDTAAAGVAKSVRNDNQFFYLTEAAFMGSNNRLRGYVGTGDRYAILEDKVGTCRWDNPLPCSKLGCDEVKTVYHVKRLNKEYKKIENHWKDMQFEHGKLEEGASPNWTACGTNAGDVTVSAVMQESKLKGCPGAGADYDPLRNMTVECGRDGTDATIFKCERKDTDAPNYYDISTSDTDTSTAYLASLGNNRFYGFWAYGGRGDSAINRKFEEERTTASTATLLSAKGFDDKRLTDRRKTPVIKQAGDLVDVTDTFCKAAPPGSDLVNYNDCYLKSAPATKAPGSSANDNGWLFEYTESGLDTHSHRTATSAAVTNYCTMWSNLFPVFSGSDACANAVAKSRFFAGHATTGLPSCSAGMNGMAKDGTFTCASAADCPEGGTCSGGQCSNFARFKETATLTPPPEPAIVKQISVTGEVRYSVMSPKPGDSQIDSMTVGVGDDPLQFIYELPVSRRLHQCRHVDASKCAPTPP